jgi:carbon monoxide dehydrogenase subunit G
MIIEKTVTFDEPIQKIWDNIMDMDGVIRCMPGVKSVEAVGEDHYRVAMEQKVGFIPVKFNLDLKITSLQAPTHIETTADGTAAGGMGKAFQKQSLDLVQISDSKTELRYKGDLNVSGRMGTFGQRVLGGKTNSVSEEFLKNFINKYGLAVSPSQ